MDFACAKGRRNRKDSLGGVLGRSGWRTLLPLKMDDSQAAVNNGCVETGADFVMEMRFRGFRGEGSWAPG